MLLRFPLMRVIFALMLTVASTAGAEEAIDRLENYLSGLETLEARFVQTIDTRDDHSKPMAGTLYLQRPGRFRWEYDGDIGQLIVADGSRVWLLDRELEQVSHQSQDDALRGTPVQLLVGEGALTEYFSAEDGGSFDGLNWIDLKPRDPESQFSLVRLAFRDDVLDRLEMLDTFGQYSRFVLTDVQRNPGLDEDLFQFRAPEGWDVFQTH